MPKTTKREATKRAARVAKAHATELSNLEVKDPQERRRSPGYRSPARGIARYPWASAIVLCLVLGSVFYLYHQHLGPFAPHAKVSATPTVAPIATVAAAQSPCNSATILAKITKTSPVPTTADVKAINHTYTKASQVIQDNKLYCAGINTNRGLIVLELNPSEAPVTVNNFVFLAENHFYDGLTFNRVIPDTSQYSGQIHIVQGGDPTGTGSGGPGYKFKDETVKGSYTAGTVAMANSGANTNGSQFFINITDNSKLLAKSYNLFGRVVKGMNVVEQIRGPNEVLASAKNIKPDVMYYVVVTPAS